MNDHTEVPAKAYENHVIGARLTYMYTDHTSQHTNLDRGQDHGNDPHRNQMFDGDQEGGTRANLKFGRRRIKFLDLIFQDFKNSKIE